MGAKLPWTLLALSYICFGYASLTLRQVNNFLGYELVSHGEIEAMRANLRYWKGKAYLYYGKWERCK